MSEPNLVAIHVARKPLSEGTVAKNALKHGTGGLNIAASRIGTTEGLNGGAYTGEGGRTALPGDGRTGAAAGMYAAGSKTHKEYVQPQGRWPANLILQHKVGCKQVGMKKVKASNQPGKSDGSISAKIGFGFGKAPGKARQVPFYTDPENYGTETVDAWACVQGCPVADLDEQSGVLKTTWVAPEHANNRQGDFLGAVGHPGQQGYNDTGGASRFFKQVQADE